MKKPIAAMIILFLVLPGCVGKPGGLSDKGLSVNFVTVMPEAIHQKTGMALFDE